MNAIEIKKAIGAIGKSATKLAHQVQITAVECLIHAVLHGDITLAASLIEALGRGGRKATLFAWFEMHGPFIVAQGKLAFRKDRVKELRAEGEDAIRARLSDVLWTDAKPEPKPVSVLDVDAEFDKFMKRIHKLATKGSIEIRNKGMLDSLEQFSNNYHAEQAMKAITALSDEEFARLYPNLRRVSQEENA